MKFNEYYWVRFSDATEDYIVDASEYDLNDGSQIWKKLSSKDHRLQKFLVEKFFPDYTNSESEFDKGNLIRWRVTTLDQLNRLADLFDFGTPKPVFRGQADYSWSLKSKLERDVSLHSLQNGGIEYVEHQLIVEAQRRLHSHFSSLPADDDIFSWIALLRHHGVPTRLLDVTRSIFIACYFAMRDAVPGRDASLWIFNRNSLSSSFERWHYRHEDRIWRPSPFGPYHDPDYQWPAPKNSKNESKPVTYASLFERGERVRLNFSSVIEAALLGFIDKRGVGISAPYWLSPRNDLQQGEFLIPFNMRHSFEDNLKHFLRLDSDLDSLDEEVEVPQDRDELFQAWAFGAVFKIRLCASLHGQLKVRLKSMNVRQQTLFPDVAGAMEYISSFVPTP